MNQPDLTRCVEALVFSKRRLWDALQIEPPAGWSWQSDWLEENELHQLLTASEVGVYQRAARVWVPRLHPSIRWADSPAKIPGYVPDAWVDNGNLAPVPVEMKCVPFAKGHARQLMRYAEVYGSTVSIGIAPRWGALLPPRWFGIQFLPFDLESLLVDRLFPTF